jgi:hypothetical protein
MEVSNYINDKYNERGTKAFNKRVKKFIENELKNRDSDKLIINDVAISRAQISAPIKHIICHDAYMTRGEGRGSYYQVIEIEMDGEIFTMRQHTNDSESWDNWHEPTKKMKRQLFEAVLESTVEQLIEELIELNES